MVLTCIKGRPALWKISLVFHIWSMQSTIISIYNDNFKVKLRFFTETIKSLTEVFLFFLHFSFQIPVTINKTFNTTRLISFFFTRKYLKNWKMETKDLQFYQWKTMCEWLKIQNTCTYSKVLKCCSWGVGGANDFGGDTRVVVVCFPGEGPWFHGSSSSSSVSESERSRKLSWKSPIPLSGIFVSFRHMGQGKCPGFSPGCLLT